MKFDILNKPFLPVLAGLFLLFQQCKPVHRDYPVNSKTVTVLGRTVYEEGQGLVLISSMSTVQFSFTGDSVQVFFKNLAPGDDYGYIVYELDVKKVVRVKITDRKEQVLTVYPEIKAPVHVLKIYKATEAQNGDLAVVRIRGRDIKPVESLSKLKIEFIGNSITCGMGADTSEVACGEGKWYDQHNAYYSYASRVARELKMRYTISAVSGVGIYRNWNSDGPAMPELYGSTYFSKERSAAWDFSRESPDYVSICLGTNDFSNGDGVTPREPFDSTRFTETYLDFVKTLYGHYDSARVVLLTSPMLSGEKADLLYRLLLKIADQVNQAYPDRKEAVVFQFEPMKPGGCDFHPSVDDHRIIAFQLVSFLNRYVKQVDPKIK
ncbi:MAG TPA: GDSL-type esterase/lipase family protein [Saprospiraceae bacterium]|nr:GDSL-type esterase/lipase family protein [Saprospiraceae bacterium]HNT19016.1 GDSL-type esterase/lipase family protein [Saprospiraceae bacterium]